MSDPSVQLARVRRQRRKLEARLPDGAYEVADLDEDQRQAFYELGPVFKREHELIGAQWLARGGRVLITPGRRPRFREPRRDVSTRVHARALSARPRGKSKPRARRVKRTSTGSRSSDDDPGEAPSAAREAVAEAWERILRRRHPGTAWEVRARLERTASKR